MGYGPPYGHGVVDVWQPFFGEKNVLHVVMVSDLFFIKGQTRVSRDWKMPYCHDMTLCNGGSIICSISHTFWSVLA